MKKIEIILFFLFISAVNLPMLLGLSPEIMAYSPQAVAKGQYWCLLTHPFAHISAYHLAIDAVAFFTLYFQLKERSAAKRLLYILSCGIVSLAAIKIQMQNSAITAYCGLSGIDHGLMIIVALELIHSDKHLRQQGLIMLAIITGKCLVEIWTGSILFAGLHFGDVGIPVTMSHAGGLAGGIVGYYICNFHTMKFPAPEHYYHK